MILFPFHLEIGTLDHAAPPFFGSCCPPLPAPSSTTLGPPDTQPAARKYLRHRHEAFCQYFVLYGNATAAAIEAGYAAKWARNQGYRLSRQPVIRARIAEIRSMLSRDYCLDADVLLGKLEAVYQRAHENHQFHAAARAVEIQARIARQAWPKPKDSPDKRRGAEPRETSGGTRKASKMTTNDDISRLGPGEF